MRHISKSVLNKNTVGDAAGGIMADVPMLVLRGADLGAAELQARTKLPPAAIVDLYEVRRVNGGTISPRAALGGIPVVAIPSRSEYN
jgi:hypothetical protein